MELFDHLNVCIYKMCLLILYLIYILKQDLALNKKQWLICHKTQPNQIVYLMFVKTEFDGR